MGVLWRALSDDRPASLRARSRGYRTIEPRRALVRHLLAPAARADRVRHRSGRRSHGLADRGPAAVPRIGRSEEHTSELQSLMRNSYAVFCFKHTKTHTHTD